MDELGGHWVQQQLTRRKFPGRPIFVSKMLNLLLRWATFVGMWLLIEGVAAQPDLARWAMMVGEFESQNWVLELESIEPGCVTAPLQPELRVQDWPARSPWAESLVAELDALPEAEHHADRALQRLLADGMRLFRLAEANGDRSRPEMEQALAQVDLPEEWALLPLVLTGWDHGYYGPGRRAGAWAMDLPTALSLGLQVRRGWDERHLPERMGPAMAARISTASVRFPDSPAPGAGCAVSKRRTIDPDFLDADLLAGSTCCASGFRWTGISSATGSPHCGPFASGNGRSWGAGPIAPPAIFRHLENGTSM